MVSTLTEFVGEILGRSISASRTVVYRGHGSHEFLLTPSIFRSQERYDNEHILLRELIAAHPDDFANDTTALEISVRMQHFTLPTRLLDISSNPLVALYFACEPVSKTTYRTVAGVRRRRTTPLDGEVVVMTLPKRRIRYFDSDTVSILANLARLRHRLKDNIDTGLSVQEFNESLPIKRLLHFVRQEKNGFEAEIEPSDLNEILLVRPKQNNRRILAQSGGFFIFGLEQELTDALPGVTIDRIAIEEAAKGPIRDDLDKMGINEKSLFPDIERAARYLVGNVASAAAVARLTP